MTTTDTTDDETEVEYVGDLDSLAELNAAFGWRLVFIPFAYVLIAFMHATEYVSFGAWHDWVFVALIGLYTIIGPAEYLYHRRRITTDT